MSSMDFAEKTRPCQDYIDSLEEERRKMEVFHRELPLSLQLISQVINGYRQKQQLTTESLFLGRSESEETSSEGPVLEEFIPLKQISSLETHEKAGKMADWLQLWNQDPSTLANEDSSMAEMKNVWGGDKKTSGMAAASSSVETGSRREEKGQTHRKSRRCWSPKLHRQFLQALHQLGGSHATPKQIRELMKVDGLTNDEVKSHLQKYRLHTSRRPSPATIRSSMTQPQQFLVVGGLWVPPPQEYRTVMQPPMEPTQVYAPVPVLPSQLHQEKQTQRSPTGPLQWEMEHPNSNSSSSSSRTTTTSPAF